MSIVVCCNLPDGIILGADSAVTIGRSVPQQDGSLRHEVIKVFTGGEKIYPLGREMPKNRFAIASYGLAALEQRTIQSWVREFSSTLGAGMPQQADGKSAVYGVAKKAREWFRGKYDDLVLPALAKERKLPLEGIPPEQQPSLGLVVAGYDVLGSERRGEVWQVQVPEVGGEPGPWQRRGLRNFGVDWFGITPPITRLILGFDPGLVDAMIDYFVKRHGVQMSEQAQGEVRKILGGAEYRIPYGQMPLEEGIRHVESLLDVVIEVAAFAPGPQVCDRPTRIAVLTQDGFDWIEASFLERRRRGKEVTGYGVYRRT